MTALHLTILVGASLVAGAMNAMAGGGTILTFPALLLLGESAIVANATSTVALLPGAVASMAAYRQEVWEHRGWLKTLFLPSLLGGATGSLLLLSTPERSFAHLAPYLILFATLLFFLQAGISRWLGGTHAVQRTPARWTLVLAFQFGVAIYGGYFGAGIGILMLAALGFMGLTDIHAMNGLKNFFGICINGVAAMIFIVRGAVHWSEALVMIAASAAAGYAGARFARRIGKDKARMAVIVIGVLVAEVLLLQQT